MYTAPLRLLRALTLSATCVASSSATHPIGVGVGVNDSALDTRSLALTRALRSVKAKPHYGWTYSDATVVNRNQPN